MKTKLPKFEGKWIPQDKCDRCDGYGQVRKEWISGGFFGGGHYEYKKCLSCDGSGKNIWSCLTCKTKMYLSDSFVCVNQDCKMYNIKVFLAHKKDE